MGLYWIRSLGRVQLFMNDTVETLRKEQWVMIARDCASSVRPPSPCSHDRLKRNVSCIIPTQTVFFFAAIHSEFGECRKAHSGASVTNEFILYVCSTNVSTSLICAGSKHLHAYRTYSHPQCIHKTACNEITEYNLNNYHYYFNN